LESLLKSVPGVESISRVRIKRRGWFSFKDFPGDQYDPGINAIIRVENDPLHPERGSVKLIMEDGV